MRRGDVLDAREVRRLLQRRRRDTGEDFQQLLERYALDRFLYRLGRSRHRSALVLKGAVLLTAWFDLPHRPTRDVDFAYAPSLGDSDAALVRDIVADVCHVEVVEDGVVFDASSIVAEEIREGASYSGIRIVFRAVIGTARVRVQVDVGFGDAIVPAPLDEQLPTLLEQEAASVLAYPREVVVAEKLEIIVQLGIVNSRMKDYFDLQALATEFNFDGDRLVDAMRATFTRRGTAIPDSVPPGLTHEFANDPGKVAQWGAFLRRIDRSDGETLPVCVSEVRRFALPVFDAVADDAVSLGVWNAGAGWNP